MTCPFVSVVSVQESLKVMETCEPVRSSLATNTWKMSAFEVRFVKVGRIPFRDSIGLHCLRTLLPSLAGRRIAGTAVQEAFYLQQIKYL
jgi:hypothetical protein